MGAGKIFFWMLGGRTSYERKESEREGAGEREGGVKVWEKREINKTAPRVTFRIGWSNGEGALARAFSARAPSSDLIRRSVGSHLSNGRSHWLMRGDSPYISLCLSTSSPLSFPSLPRSVYLSLSFYLQPFSINTPSLFSHFFSSPYLSQFC